MRRHLFLPLFMVATMGVSQTPTLVVALPMGDLGRSRSGTISVYDPVDVPNCDIPVLDCPADIRFISQRSFTGGTGRRMLAYTVAAFDPHEEAEEVRIMLRFDTNGGPSADWYVHMGSSAGVRGWFCAPRIWSRRYRIEIHGELMTCFIPERDLHATKSIRSRVLSKIFQKVVDRAPDQGWAG